MGFFEDDIFGTKKKKTDSQKRRSSLTASMKKNIMISVGAKCEKPRCTNKTYEVHHIKPLEKTGSNTPANLIALCANCHKDAHSGVLKQSDQKKAIVKRNKKVKDEIKGILSKRTKVSKPKKPKDPFGLGDSFGVKKKRGRKKDDIFSEGFL